MEPNKFETPGQNIEQKKKGGLEGRNKKKRYKSANTPAM